MCKVVVFACRPNNGACAGDSDCTLANRDYSCDELTVWLRRVLELESSLLEILFRMKHKCLYPDASSELRAHSLSYLFDGLNEDSVRDFCSTVNFGARRDVSVEDVCSDRITGSFAHVLLRGNEYAGHAYSRMTSNRLSVHGIRTSLVLSLRQNSDIDVTRQLIASAQRLARQLDLKGISVTEPLENAAKVALLLGFGRKQSDSYDVSRTALVM